MQKCPDIQLRHVDQNMSAKMSRLAVSADKRIKEVEDYAKASEQKIAVAQNKQGSKISDLHSRLEAEKAARIKMQKESNII